MATGARRDMSCFVFLFTCLSGTSAKLLSLTAMYGMVQSPHFPEPYPRETEVRWNISLPEGFQIRLYFSHFDLEPSYLCEYDYVKVEAEEEVLAVFCGQERTDTEEVPGERVITSPRNRLSLLFSSDFSNEERFSGFLAHYSAADEDECNDRNDDVCDHYCHNYIGGYYCSCRYGYQLHTDNRTCRVDCSDGVYRERSGVLSSVDFPRPYPRSSDCVYRIQLDEGFTISLLFDGTFDIEDHPDISCPYDHLKVEVADGELGPFCGNRSPGLIQTNAHEVLIRFHSDGSGENFGWRLTYTSTGSQCPVPERQPNVLLNPDQSEYSFRNHILVTCQPGYRLLKDGESLDHYQIHCQRDGTWSSSIPQCQVVDCGSPTVGTMADVVFGSHDNSTLFGATITYTCKGAFQLHPNINSLYTCQEMGVWTHSELGSKLPSCLPACGQSSQALPSQQKRVVGGRSAVLGLFPWQVLLSIEDLSRVPEEHWFGSGALLSESWVITAAHVLRSHRRDASVVPVAPEHVKVYLGLHDVRDKQRATKCSVDSIILHPNFQPRNYDNDIALVRLSKGVELNTVVRPICLPPPRRQDRPSDPLPFSLGVVAGWGISHPNASSSSSSASTLNSDASMTSELGLTSDILQWVKLPVVSQEECQASYASRSLSYNITDNMFCAGFYEGGRDTCLGDSGGAFVMEDGVSQQWVVFGLVSWGGPEECGSERVYGVYTRVANYVEWIWSHLDSETNTDSQFQSQGPENQL